MTSLEYWAVSPRWATATSLRVLFYFESKGARHQGFLKFEICYIQSEAPGLVDRPECAHDQLGPELCMFEFAFRDLGWLMVFIPDSDLL